MFVRNEVVRRNGNWNECKEKEYSFMVVLRSEDILELIHFKILEKTISYPKEISRSLSGQFRL
jgi:hypothetical protein